MVLSKNKRRKNESRTNPLDERLRCKFAFIRPILVSRVLSIPPLRKDHGCSWLRDCRGQTSHSVYTRSIISLARLKRAREEEKRERFWLNFP